jgi:hypothetical protein
MPLEHPYPREELGRNQCAFCHQEGHWKNKCPKQAKDSQKAPKTRGKAQVIEGKYQPTHKGPNSWEENIVSLAGLEGLGRLGQTRLYTTGPPGAYGPNEDGGAIPLISWWTWALSIQCDPTSGSSFQ